MKRFISRVALAAAVVCVTSVVSMAQQTSTSTLTKGFEVIAVEGNRLVVRLPEGTRELTVADDFRFTVNGQQLSVRELKPGMKGTATITTKTTSTPVTATTVKNGVVVARSGPNIIVKTDEGTRMFSQGDVDKRGVSIVRNGVPAQVSDFREGDQLTATIITSLPPRVMTETEVQAIVSKAAATSGGAPPVAASAARATAPQAPSMAQTDTTRTLPRTASSWPFLALAGVLSMAMGLVLTITRRLAR